MKIIKKLSEDEAKALMPEGLQDALWADPDETIYCMLCDGVRLKKHKCIPCVPLKFWAEGALDGYDVDEEWMKQQREVA